MATTPTNKPVGSSDPRDLLFNSEKFDEVVNSESLIYVDRKDNTRLTIKGLEEAAVSAGPTVEAAIRANEQANEVKKSSDEIVAATEGYIESARVSAGEAYASAVVSEESAVQAKTAADAATVSANVYPDITSGLAATTDGQQFQVAEGEFITRYRRDSALSAVKVASYPSSEFVRKTDRRVDDLGITTNFGVPGYAKVEMDSYGQIATGINDNGGFETAGAVLEASDGDYDHVIIDDHSRIPFGVRKDGSVDIPELNGYVGISYFESKLAEMVEKIAQAGIGGELLLPPLASTIQLLLYGQSLSIGVDGLPAISTTPSSKDIMFAYGANSTRDPLPNHYPTKPYAEGAGARDWETPGAGILETIHNLCQREDSHDNNKFLMAGAGLASRSIEELSKGTVNFDRLTQTINNGVDVANRDGVGTSLGGMFWVGGEDNLSNPDSQYYAGEMMTLRSDTQAVRAGTQSGNLPMFSYQTAPPTRDDLDTRWGVPNGQLLASEQDPYIFLATPTYWMTYNADGVHMPNWSYKLLGAYLGKAWKRVMIDRKKWRPLSPTAISYSGNQVDINLHVANSGLVIEPGSVHAGFRLKDINGYATITNVEIINDSSVRITANRVLLSPLQISYARQRDGKVRDTATEHEYIDIAGTRHALHNYLVAFMREI